MQTIKRFFLLGAVIFVFMGCGSKETEMKKISSPTGKYKIGISVNEDKAAGRRHLCLKIHLFDRRSKELAVMQTGAKSQMDWVAGWMDKEDVVVLYGVGAGVQAWEIRREKEFRTIEATRKINQRIQRLKEDKYYSRAG